MTLVTIIMILAGILIFVMSLRFLNEKRTHLISFGEIIETLPSEIFIFDSNTLKFVNVNEAGRKNLGRSLTEILQMTPVDIKPDFDEQAFVDYVEPLRSGKEDKLLFETRYERKDGSCYQVDVTLQMSEYLGEKVFVANIFDVTDRKQSETFIREKSDFLTLILEKSPGFICVKDVDFNIVEANEKFLSLYPENMRDTVIGSTTFESYTKEDKDAFLENDKIAFETGYSEVTETIKMPMGETMTLFTQKVRFEDAKGTPFILVIAVDVTDREELIQKLANSNEELERFAYVCSHDLQEPLRMIRSFTDRLKVHLKDTLKDDPKGQKYFDFVTDGAERSQQLITDILSYSSIDNNPQHLETFEARELIDVVKKNLVLQLDERQAEITYDSLPALKGNKTQIYQLFQNLINNGLKYQTPNTNPHVHIGFEELASHYKFEIKDNGIGIDSKNLKKVFDVFQRLHRRDQYSGTGVGLAICKKIVNQHGGDIWVESEVGEGSSFFFTLKKLSIDTVEALESEAA